ncbi:FAD-binding protein [Myceligenerans cantabricum]
MSHLDRRTFSATDASAVVAFDPVASRWLTAAQAGRSAGSAGGPPRVPPLDGELVSDPESLAEAARDYGRVVHHAPGAVLRPGSVRDVRTMVRFAGTHGLTVAVRGQGHSVDGQAQAEGGVVVDSRTLATIHHVGADRAVVDAGVTWRELTLAAHPVGLAPPVVTDYLGLSVGGVLSLGGLGGATQHHGFVVDTVIELEVVTGDGRLVTCSAEREPRLFEAVLGGLGQFGIIARATVAMTPAGTTARVYHLFYDTVPDLLAAQRRALADKRFDYLEGQLVPGDDGGWAYLLEAASFRTPPQEPDDDALLTGLAPASAEIADQPYPEWLRRVDESVEQIEAAGLGAPWINLLVPDAAADAVVAGLADSLTPADAVGVALVYPIDGALLTRPNVRVPEGSVVYTVALLRVVDPADEAAVERLVAANDRLYAAVLEAGGTQYPASMLTMTPDLWRRHLGDRWDAAVADKERYDPRRVLSPGQGIFPR